MENNELFQTIEQLKNTLSDVASARQQVEDVILLILIQIRKSTLILRTLKELKLRFPL